MANIILNKIKDRYYLHRYVFPFIKRNENRVISTENTLCIFCHPRGGSTWLMEILSEINRSCYFDEPLLRSPYLSNADLPFINMRKIKEIAELGFYFEQPIPTNENWPAAYELFTKLLKGHAMSIGLYKESGLKKLNNADFYMIKFNYGHLLMHWLIKNFHAKFILLTRHPCAVIASQLQHNWFENLKIDKNKQIPDFNFNLIFKQYENIYQNINSTEEYFAFLWSLRIKETFYKDINKNNYITVAYESLIANYPNEISRIFNYLDKEPPQKVYDHFDIPSKSTEKYAYSKIGHPDQLKSWQGYLTKKQIKNILTIVEKFEIDIYSSAIEPDYDKLYK